MTRTITAPTLPLLEALAHKDIPVSSLFWEETQAIAQWYTAVFLGASLISPMNREGRQAFTRSIQEKLDRWLENSPDIVEILLSNNQRVVELTISHGTLTTATIEAEGNLERTERGLQKMGIIIWFKKGLVQVQLGSGVPTTIYRCRESRPPTTREEEYK